MQQALGYAGDNPGLQLTIELSLVYAMVSGADFACAADQPACAPPRRSGRPSGIGGEALAAAAIARLPARAWHSPRQGGDWRSGCRTPIA